MITKPTVFVIGAGGSVPYGFPSGAQLIRDLIADPSAPQQPLPHADFYDDVNTPDEKPRHVVELEERFRLALKDSRPKSIDDWLFHRRADAELVKHGKRALASRLIAHERHDKLMGARWEEDWLTVLWHAMMSPFEEFSQNQVGFVVFNYDRCIEHFFTTVLCNTYVAPKATACKAASAIPVLHVHGVLAPYGTSPSGKKSLYSKEVTGRTSRMFESVSDYDSVELATEHLRLFWETPKDEVNVGDKAAQLIGNAQRVVFLGFGFLENNVPPIFNAIGKCRHRPEMFATTLGLSKKTRGALEGRLPDLKLLNMDSRTALHEEIPLD